MNDLTLTVPVIARTTEQVELSIKRLSIQVSSPDVHASIALALGARDESGEWRADVPDVCWEVADDPLNTDIAKQHQATQLIGLIMTAIVADGSGLTVKDAGKALCAQHFAAMTGDGQ